MSSVTGSPAFWKPACPPLSGSCYAVISACPKKCCARPGRPPGTCDGRKRRDIGKTLRIRPHFRCLYYFHHGSWWLLLARTVCDLPVELSTFLEVPCHFLGTLQLRKRGSVSTHKEEIAKVAVSGYKTPGEGLGKSAGFHHSVSQQNVSQASAAMVWLFLTGFFFKAFFFSLLVSNGKK